MYSFVLQQPQWNWKEENYSSKQPSPLFTTSCFRWLCTGSCWTAPAQWPTPDRLSVSSEKNIPCSVFLALCYCPPVRLSVCRLSVTFVRPTQATEIFGNVSTPSGTMAKLAIYWHPGKILRRSSTLRRRELNTRGIAEYSDFRPTERCISKMEQR